MLGVSTKKCFNSVRGSHSVVSVFVAWQKRHWFALTKQNKKIILFWLVQWEKRELVLAFVCLDVLIFCLKIGSKHSCFRWKMSIFGYSSVNTCLLLLSLLWSACCACSLHIRWSMYNSCMPHVYANYLSRVRFHRHRIILLLILFYVCGSVCIQGHLQRGSSKWRKSKINAKWRS